jgi:hypothetical protein
MSMGVKLKPPAEEYEELKNYENEVLEKIQQDDLFADIGTTEDMLGEFIDKVIDRSLYLYRNR